MTVLNDQNKHELTDLIARCVLRDQKSLERIYHLCSGYLNAVIYRIVKSDDIAKDVLQETFVQIWNNASSYRPDKALPITWMTSIARYRALDRLDKEKRIRSKIAVTENGDDSYDQQADESSLSPEMSMYSKQLNTHILDCMAGLSEDIRRSIKLAYLDGFSRDEIAEKLNAKTNTVKSWLHRGADRLKKCLQSKITTTA